VFLGTPVLTTSTCRLDGADADLISAEPSTLIDRRKETTPPRVQIVLSKPGK